MKYIYLDWNVFQTIEHSRNSEKINFSELKLLLKRLRNKYSFPFSEAHLKDLATNCNVTNKKNIKSHLIFLQNFTDNYFLDNSGELLIPTKSEFKIFHFFKMIVRDQKQEEIELKNININMDFESINVDTERLEQDDLFMPLLKENDGVLDSYVFQNVLKKLTQSINDPDYYKQLRLQLANIKNKFEKKETILDQKSECFEKIIPFLEFICSENPENYLNDFDKIIKSFLSFNKKSLTDMKIGKKIEFVYMLMDIHPQYRDKINKKNRFSNVARDCKHLYFASQAEYYVTEDGHTKRKAEFVCKALSLKVKIVSINEFMEKFYIL